MTENPRLQIIIATGPEDQSRATLGFAMAAAAAASGTDVTVFLILSGIWWSRPSKQRSTAVAGFPSISELMEALELSGGRVEGCSACLENAKALLQEGECELAATPAGLTEVAVRMASCQTVVF